MASDAQGGPAEARPRRPPWAPDFRGLPRPFWVLFAGTLVNRIGGFVLVFLVIYLTEVQGFTAGEAGAVMSMYGLGAIAGGPLGGALSDRIGRRPTLIVSLIGGGSSMLLLGLASGTAAITLAAGTTGLLYEAYRPVVAATIADVVGPPDRLRAYNLIYWAVNIGASIAPVLGGFVAAHSYRLLFALDGATAALYGAILWLALPETRPAGKHSDKPARVGIGVVLRDRVFIAMCLLSLAFSIVFFQSFVGLPMDMRAHGLSTASFGGVIALNGVLIVMLQPLAGELIRSRSRPPVLATASVLLAIGFGMNAWIDTVAWYALAVCIWTLGEILFAPASVSLVADLAAPDLRGRYQGVYAIATTAAFAAAPAVGGYTVGAWGTRSLWLACGATGLLVAAGFLALPCAAPDGVRPRSDPGLTPV